MATPVAISNLAASVGDAEIELSWTTPSNGGSTITDHDVDYRLSTEQKINFDGVNNSLIYGGNSSRTATTLFELRFDLALDDWTPGTTARAISGNDYILEFRSSQILFQYFTGSAYPYTVTTAATLGLTDGVRAQLRVRVDTDTNTVNWYVRTGDDIRDLASDEDWGSSLASTSFIGTVTSKSSATGLYMNICAADGGSSTPSIVGDFYRVRCYDVDNAAVELDVSADDVSTVAYGALFTARDGNQYGTYYAPSQSMTLSSVTSLSWLAFADGTTLAGPITVTGLTNDQAYGFRVRAVNADGNAAWSNIATATPISTFQIWDGTEWVNATVEVWNGASWIAATAEVVP